MITKVSAAPRSKIGVPKKRIFWITLRVKNPLAAEAKKTNSNRRKRNAQ
jgi:hypothetical protein